MRALTKCAAASYATLGDSSLLSPVSAGGELRTRAALIVVDMQVDFCLGGALPVEGADSIVPLLNDLMAAFGRAGRPVFLTRDRHPPNHVSFEGRGGRWPPHCVTGTNGAEFHPGLRRPRGAIVIDKGSDPDVEAYSGFQGTDLQQRLREKGVTDLFVGGVATDYCVEETVLDALRHGFGVYLVEDGVRAVNASPGDGRRAVDAMTGAGARLTGARSATEMVSGA